MKNQEKIVPNDIQLFFEELNKKNINYCHWKSNEHLYEGLIGKTDLDILVLDSDYDKFIRVLKNNHFCNVLSAKWQCYPNVEDWIGMDSKTGIQVHIHLHRRLITGKTYVKEQYLPLENFVLKTKIKSEYGIFICNPNIEIIILLFRALLKRPDYNVILNNNSAFKFNKSIKKELDYLYGKIDKEIVSNNLSELFDIEISELILSIIFDGVTNNKMRILKKKIVKIYSNDRRKSKIVSFIQNIYRYYLIKIMYKLKKPINLKKKIKYNGISIAFLGVDGSGKSTVSEIIMKWLGWKIDCKYLYMGTGNENKNILNKILRKYSSGKKTQKKVVSQNDDNCGRKNPKKGFKLLIINYNNYLNAKVKLKNVRKMLRLIDKGCIVLMDRYPQLQYIGINDGPVITEIGTGIVGKINKILQNKERKVFSNISLYSPMLVFKLKISFETSRSRKQDSSEQTIKRKINIIDDLKFENSKEICIDNNGEIDDTILQVKNEIWKYIVNIQRSKE